MGWRRFSNPVCLHFRYEPDLRWALVPGLRSTIRTSFAPSHCVHLPSVAFPLALLTECNALGSHGLLLSMDAARFHTSGEPSTADPSRPQPEPPDLLGKRGQRCCPRSTPRAFIA